MGNNREWEELNFVNDEDWPLPSHIKQDEINKTLPLNLQFVRMETTEYSGYALMKQKE